MENANSSWKRYQSLNAFDLKMIAIVSMLLDHAARILFPQFGLLTWIGRIAFALFSFLLAEGFVHTRNVQKYAGRLALWALLSEIPYDLAFHNTILEFQHQNVLFTLLSGLLGLIVVQSAIPQWSKILAVLALAFLATVLNFDYAYLGVLQIVLFYIFRRQHMQRFLSITLLNFTFWGRFTVQGLASLAFIPISLYNGKRGYKTGMLFYTIYAGHLIIYWLIKGYILSAR